MRRSHPLIDQLPAEHTGPHPHLVQYTYFCNCLFVTTTHTHSHTRQIEVQWLGIFWWSTCCLLCVPNHIAMTVHTPAFLRVGEHSTQTGQLVGSNWPPLAHQLNALLTELTQLDTILYCGCCLVNQLCGLPPLVTNDVIHLRPTEPLYYAIHRCPTLSSLIKPLLCNTLVPISKNHWEPDS